MKVVALKRTAAEKKAEKTAGGFVNPDDEGGITVHLGHDHLKKMGLAGSLKSGDRFKLKGHGRVEESETRSGKDGERHSARLRLEHAGVDGAEPDVDDKTKERAGRRSDIERAYTESEAKRK
jgi:hypothetical protein